MKLTTWILASLMLAIGAADGFASTAVDGLEGALRQRMAQIDAGGDIDKVGRKRRKAIFKCLKRMGKTREDLKDDVELLDKIVNKLRKRFADDEQMFAVVSAAAAVVWFDTVTTLDGLKWKVEEGEAITGSRRAKAQRYVDQADAHLNAASRMLTMNEPVGEGVFFRAKALPTEDLALDWTNLRSALENMRRSVKRFPKLFRWLGPQACPGRPIGPGESAALEYARDQGALVIASRAAVTHVEGIVYEDAPVEAVILLAVCRPGEPTLIVELSVSGPLFPAAWEGEYAADGSHGAAARVTLYGPHGYPGGGRPAVGAVTITGFDPATERMSGTFEVSRIGDSGRDGVDIDIDGFFDIDVECRGRAE